MLSDTLPIRKRSTAFIPVAPQIIKSALKFSAISFAIFTLGEPYSTHLIKSVSPAAFAFATYASSNSFAYSSARSDNVRSYASAVAKLRESTTCARIRRALLRFAISNDF